MTPEILERLLELEQKLKGAPRIPIPIDGGWAIKIPARGGVYAIWRGDDPVYVGETCHLKHRFGDLVRSKHHGFRRLVATTLGIKLDCVADELAHHYQISFLTDFIGRKELEEFLVVRWLPEWKRGRIRYCDNFNDMLTALPISAPDS
jgi:hypothetical protein